MDRRSENEVWRAIYLYVLYIDAWSKIKKADLNLQCLLGSCDAA